MTGISLKLLLLFGGTLRSKLLGCNQTKLGTKAGLRQETNSLRFNAVLRIIRKLIIENRDGKTECACFDGVWLTIIVLLKSATRDKKKEVQI